MGKPGLGNTGSSCAEYIGAGGKPGELKHLSTPRKRKQTAIPSVAASESGTAQTARMFKAVSVVRAGLRDISSRPYGTSGGLQIRLLVEFLLDKRSHRG